MRWCRLAFFAAATMLVSAAHAQTTITFRFNDPEALQMRQNIGIGVELCGNGGIEPFVGAQH